jgi:hypothetical protein
LNADRTITIKFSDEQLNLLRQPLPNNKIQDVNLVRINGQIPRTVGMLGGGVSLYVTEY